MNPWVGKIPWRRERLPTPVFWPGEFHEVAESDTTEPLSLSHIYICVKKCTVVSPNEMDEPRAYYTK